jgi:hypothetical protein
VELVVSTSVGDEVGLVGADVEAAAGMATTLKESGV